MSSKKPTAKKTTVKKTATKSPTAKKSPRKSPAKQIPLKSFRPAPDTEKFFNFRINQQTIYWLIIGIMMLTFAAWVYKVQSEINAIYDHIELMQVESEPVIDLPEETSEQKTN